MKLEVDHVSGITVIKVAEGLVGDESDEMVTAVNQCLEEGSRLFIFDLSESGKIESSGLQSLIQAYIEASKQSAYCVAVMPNSFFELLPHPHTPIMELYGRRGEAIEAMLEHQASPDRKSTVGGDTKPPGPHPQRQSVSVKSLKTVFCAGALISVAMSLISTLVWLAIRLIQESP